MPLNLSLENDRHQKHEKDPACLGPPLQITPTQPVPTPLGHRYAAQRIQPREEGSLPTLEMVVLLLVLAREAAVCCSISDLEATASIQHQPESLCMLLCHARNLFVFWRMA